MKILIDIGHPAHVHYFKNFISIMQSKEHQFIVFARNRPLIHYLLKANYIAYHNRGKGRNTIIGKLLYIIYADILLVRKCIREKPDLALSFASPYAAHAAWLLRIPHIVLDDTEHAKLGQLLYKPFSSVFINPFCFYKDFGERQIFFNSCVEYFYLHPAFFNPTKKVFSFLGINPNEKFVILRFVSWQANHDIGHSGIDISLKHKLISALEHKYHIFISSENNEIDSSLEKYLINIPPELMHDALFYADFIVTESGTMASEASILNTPAIYVNSLPLMGYLIEEKKAGILFHFTNSKAVIEKTCELMELNDIKSIFKKKNSLFLQDFINPTTFLVWFIENYPESFQIMKDTPSYQQQF